MPSGRSTGEKKLLTKQKWILLRDIPKPWKTALFSQWHRQPNKKSLSSPNRDHKYDYLVTRLAYCYRTEKSTRLLARNDINMELRWVTSHCSGNEPLPLLPLLPLAKEQARTLEWQLWCLTASYLNYENTNQTDHQWSELRDYSNSRQIQQDSQRLKGGGEVINKSAHKEGGGLPDFFNFFVLVSNRYFQSSRD